MTTINELNTIELQGALYELSEHIQKVSDLIIRTVPPEELFTPSLEVSPYSYWGSILRSLQLTRHSLNHQMKDKRKL